MQMLKTATCTHTLNYQTAGTYIRYDDLNNEEDAGHESGDLWRRKEFTFELELRPGTVNKDFTRLQYCAFEWDGGHLPR